MLTQFEKAGIKSFLPLLSREDLQSLATTLTKGQIAVGGRRECEEAILAFVESGKDFLHRRVCSKAVLVQYAYRSGLAVTTKLTKEDVISLILDHWSGSGDKAQAACSPTNNNNVCQSLSEPNTSGVSVVQNYNVNVNVQYLQVAQSNNHHEIELDKQFGEQFAHWFYDMLNHADPVSQGFAPSSFLPGVAVRTRQSSLGFNDEQVITGCDDVAKYFLELFSGLKLLPNFSGNGLRTKSDPHGLRIVLVCGTVFKGDTLLGVFQQSFGLVQDPSNAQTWKIQVSELRLKAMIPREAPQLDHFPDIPEIEANTIKLLQQSIGTSN